VKEEHSYIQSDLAGLQGELEKLHGASFGWALSCCRRDHSEAEEVLQTVYLKIMEGKARYRGEASFKTWLFAVIRQTAISEYRKRLLGGLRSLATSNSSAQRDSLAAAPAQCFERLEAQQQFQTTLKRLPVRQREVLHLVFYEDLTLREAAQVMGISLGSACQHYERGKNRLRLTLSREELKYGIGWHRKENPGAIS
jgi:RNA polymerase sigma-70 factor (ECF subfamily)